MKIVHFCTKQVTIYIFFYFTITLSSFSSCKRKECLSWMSIYYITIFIHSSYYLFTQWCTHHVCCSILKHLVMYRVSLPRAPLNTPPVTLKRNGLNIMKWKFKSVNVYWKENLHLFRCFTVRTIACASQAYGNQVFDFFFF